MARLNCVWSPRHPDNGGIKPDLGMPAIENLVTDPEYVDRGGKDFRLREGSPCRSIAPNALAPVARRPGLQRAKRGARCACAQRLEDVRPGGRVRLRARVVGRWPWRRRAVLKNFRNGAWRRVGTMRLRAGRYVATVRSRAARAHLAAPRPRADRLAPAHAAAARVRARGPALEHRRGRVRR